MAFDLHKKLDKNKAKIIKLYKSGKSCEEISKTLNISSSSTISRYLKSINILRTHSEQLKDLAKANRGRKHTKKSKINMSNGIKKSYIKNPKLRKVRSEWSKKMWNALSGEERKARYSKGLKTMQLNAQKKNVSSIEIIVKKQLDKLNIRYIHQKQICNGKYILDFYIPSKKLVIECNGDYWHKRPERIKRDNELSKYVKSCGRKIIFIWEHEIKDEWFDIRDYIGDIRL